MSHTEGETIHSSVSKKNNMKKKKYFHNGNIQLVLLRLAKVSDFTLASFSVASVSCLTGAVIRSKSIEAVGINVTHRRRSTAFVNVYTFKQKLLNSIILTPNIRPTEHSSYLTCEFFIKIYLSSFVFCQRCGKMKNWQKAKSVADYIADQTHRWSSYCNKPEQMYQILWWKTSISR